MKSRTQQCLQSVSGFRYKIPKNTSQSKLTNVLINDMFTNKKIQVKVPHTILTKSNIFINRIYSRSSKDNSENKNKNIHSSIKRRGYIQTFKCIEVKTQQQKQKINNRMQKIYQEIQRNDLNKGMDKQLKAFRRTIFSRRTSESYKKQQKSQILKRGSLSVDFSQYQNKIVEQHQNQHQQPVLKNWHDFLEKKNQEINKPIIKIATKQNNIEYKRARSSLGRKQKSVNSSKYQTICGWNNDENSEFIC